LSSVRLLPSSTPSSQFSFPPLSATAAAALQPKKGAIWRVWRDIVSGRSEKAEKQPSKACLLLRRVSALAKAELPEFSRKIKNKKKKAIKGPVGFGCLFTQNEKTLLSFASQHSWCNLGCTCLPVYGAAALPSQFGVPRQRQGEMNAKHLDAAALGRPLHEKNDFFYFS